MPSSSIRSGFTNPRIAKARRVPRRIQHAITRHAIRKFERNVSWSPLRANQIFLPIEYAIVRLRRQFVRKIIDSPEEEHARLAEEHFNDIQENYFPLFNEAVRRAAVASASRELKLSRKDRNELMGLAANKKRSKDIIDKAIFLLGKEKGRVFARRYEHYGRPLITIAEGRMARVLFLPEKKNHNES